MCSYSHILMGVSENSVPLNPMVLLIIIPMKNCYFIGNIPNIFRQTLMIPQVCLEASCIPKLKRMDLVKLFIYPHWGRRSTFGSAPKLPLLVEDTCHFQCQFVAVPTRLKPPPTQMFTFLETLTVQIESQLLDLILGKITGGYEHYWGLHHQLLIYLIFWWSPYLNVFFFRDPILTVENSTWYLYSWSFFGSRTLRHMPLSIFKPLIGSEKNRPTEWMCSKKDGDNLGWTHGNEINPLGIEFGCVWKCCVPLNPMVLLIIIPMKWL